MTNGAELHQECLQGYVGADFSYRQGSHSRAAYEVGRHMRRHQLGIPVTCRSTRGGPYRVTVAGEGRDPSVLHFAVYWSATGCAVAKI